MKAVESKKGYDMRHEGWGVGAGCVREGREERMIVFVVAKVKLNNYKQQNNEMCTLLTFDAILFSILHTLTHVG